MRALIVTLLALPLLGCIMVVEDRQPEPAPQYMAVDDDEVRFVIYREYYGCGHAEIAYMRHYRLYYGYDDCDLWFLLFLSRHLHLDFHIVIRRYEACGRRMHILVRDSGCDPDIFFVRVVDVDRCPPPYGRAYGYWKKRQLHAIELSNDEYRALIDLRIGVDFYGHSPEIFFARIRTNEMPCRVLYREYRDAGKGGRDCSNKVIVKGERPWELPRERREAWKREAKEREEKAHEKFKDEHAEKVREHRAKEDKNWREDDERGPSRAKPETPAPREPGTPSWKRDEEREPKPEPRGPSRPPSREPPSKNEDDERGPSKREEPRGPSTPPKEPPSRSEEPRGPGKPPSKEPPARSEEPRGPSKAPPKEPPAKSEEPRGPDKSKSGEPPAKNEPKGKSKEDPRPEPEPHKPQDEEKGKKKK